MDKNTLSHELAIKYTFENFDFKNSSPEDLIKSYQENYSKIYDVIDTQEKETHNSHAEKMIKFTNF